MGQRQQRICSIQLRASEADVRVETLRGQEHVVVPVVMLVEGVIQGALAEVPELALASEFGSNPTAWNGCPVPVTHPQRAGVYVSAGNPNVWGAEVIGFLFNTGLQDKSLCSEIWINRTWAEESGFDDVLNALEGGEVMEVSTGLFANVVEVQGVHDGETYGGVWTNVVPDHLALLPNSIGACSVEMGAGTNRTPSVNMADFAIEKIRTTGKNAQRLMSINQSVTKEPDKMPTSTPAPSLLQRVLGTLNTEGVELSDKDKQFKANLAGISDGDLRTAIASALSKESEYCYVMAVFDDSVVYEAWVEEDYSWRLLQRPYKLNGGATGTVEFTGEGIEVRPLTSFVPVNQSTQKEETRMNTKAKNNTEDDAATETAAATTTAQEPAKVEVTQEDAAKVFGAPASEITSALALQAERRAKIVGDVLAINECPFTEEELKGFSVQQLEKILSVHKAAPAKTTPAAEERVNYSGAAGAAPAVKEPGYSAPVKAFSAKK